MRSTRPSLLVLSVLFLGLLTWWFWPQPEVVAPPADPQRQPAAADKDLRAEGQAARPTEAGAQAGETREALADPSPRFELRGVLLAQPQLSPQGVVVLALPGKASDRHEGFMGTMGQISRADRRDDWVQSMRRPDPEDAVARAEVDAAGRFALTGMQHQHLRLYLHHTHYGLDEPHFVHLRVGRPGHCVLKPYLGGWIRGRVRLPRGGDTAGLEVRLLAEMDMLRMMQDPSRAVSVAAQSGLLRAPVAADGSFELRAVQPSPALYLLLKRPLVAQQGPRSLAAGETIEVVLHPIAESQLGRVRVKVSDAEGEACSAGQVRMVPEDLGSMQLRMQGARGARLRAGEASIAQLRPGRYQLQVQTPGWPAHQQAAVVDAGAEQLIEVVLDGGLQIEGRVLDVDGKPVAEAGIAPSPAVEIPMLGDLSKAAGLDLLATTAQHAELRTDPEGRFRIRILKDRPAHLVAAHPREGLGMTSEAPDGKQPVEIRLQRPGLLRGRVQSGHDGEPVTAFSLRVLRRMAMLIERPARVEQVETSDGSFELGSLHPGAATLEIRAPGHGSLRRSVDLQAGAELDLGELRLPAGVSIRGRVLDADQRPVAGARISRDLPGMLNNPALKMMMGRLQATSDEQGRYEMQDLPPGRYRFRAEHQDFAAGRSKLVKLAAGEASEDLDIELRRGGRIEGSLLLPAMRDGSGYLITAQDQRSGVSKTCGVRADGSFVIDPIDAGRYEVTAMHQGLIQEFQNLDAGTLSGQPDIGGMIRKAQRFTARADCRVRDGETSKVEIDVFHLFDPGTRVEIEVLLGDAPMDSAFLDITRLPRGQRHQAFLQGGKALLEDFPPGVAEVQVRQGLGLVPIGEAQRIEVPKQKLHRVRIRLAAGVIAGRVVDETDGEPLAGAMVRLHSHAQEGADPSETGFASCDAEGRFRFVGLPPGRYSLLCNDSLFAGTRDKGQAGRLEHVQLGAGERREDLVLEARPAARVEAQVSDELGTPVAQARVYALDERGRLLGQLPQLTDRQGRCQLGGLAAGSLRLLALAPRKVPGISAARQIQGLGKTELQVQVSEGPRVSMRVEEASGKAQRQVRLAARWQGSPWIPLGLVQRWDEEGQHFDLGHLPSGRIEFRAHIAGAAAFVATRQIPAGTQLSLVLTQPR